MRFNNILRLHPKDAPNDTGRCRRSCVMQKVRVPTIPNAKIT
jgi:hypothetical protein